MINTEDYYRKLITSEYRYAQKYNAMLKKLISYGLDMDTAAENLILSFDVDTAVGAQLDILGRIVGVSRTVSFQPSVGSPVLSDDVYRLVIKAKIVKNVWKGTIDELYSLWIVLFPSTKVLQVQDLQDMSFNLVLQGDYTTLERELVLHGYIIPKPEGVRINILTFLDMNGRPLFSYDYKTLDMNGYSSHWAAGG